ncbi:MAG TPA: V-type ATPase 116kDa subunit family protein [Acidimicrobiales bacterium]|nr:V-type ATPase 116kDa subunit family protein [Acidimicrobiales bacterium]
MPWRESFEPVRMDRVALVAPAERLEEVLRAVSDAGTVQLELVQPDAPIGETEGAAITHDRVAALVGWSPHQDVAGLRERVTPLGGAVVHLRSPRGAEPPTLLTTDERTGASQALVETYATIPYADLNPAIFAGTAYIVMFGMMFGDVGHGALLAAGGVLLTTGRPRALARFRRLGPFVVGAGLCSMVFGFAFGDAFGPTGLVPTLWMAPLDHPTRLLAVGIALGALLLAVSYVLGSVNRWREGGPGRALVATSGLAGAGVYLGLGLLVLGWYEHLALALGFGAFLVAGGLVLGFLGCSARGEGVAQAVIEVFDSVLRIGTNTVSFTRLAAFGLIHAALVQTVWSGTTALSRRGFAFWLAAAVVFVLGNALAFALEGLVAGIQALRLEYYELFSRIFVSVGQPFHPWRAGDLAMSSSPPPTVSSDPLPSPKEDSCSRG